MLRAAWPRRFIVSSTLPVPAKGRLSIAPGSALETEGPLASVIAPERTRATVRSSSIRSMSWAIMRSRKAASPPCENGGFAAPRQSRTICQRRSTSDAQRPRRRRRRRSPGAARPCRAAQADAAPRQLPSRGTSWNASSSSSCRFSRKKPNSARTRVSRFISIFSWGDSATGGADRCMLVPPAGTR
jgi:hypothetical protein